MVKRVASAVVVLASLLGLSPATYAEPAKPAPVPVIFDTDMWSDIDDVLALAMLHALEDRGEIDLVAVTVSMDDKWCAPYVDLIDTFYGHPDIPVGVVRGGPIVDTFRKLFPKTQWPTTRYTEHFSQRKSPQGALIYPHRLTDGAQAPEAVGLLRKTLAAQPDGSVVVIQVGHSTNLARLLASAPDAASSASGLDLVKRKVRLLSVMAGNFADSKIGDHVIPKGEPEFNLMPDVPSAQKLFEQWPTPVVVSGFEVGLELLYPAVSIEHDFNSVTHHPVAETYRWYSQEQGKNAPWPHDHATFDLTSVLYAARPDRGYFSLSPPGKVSVLADARTRFEPAEKGLHRYLIIEEKQKARVLEALTLLASQPPRAGLKTH